MSDMCVFLGYSVGYKWVLCYNRATKRLLLSRHIVYDESVFPFQSSGSSTLHQSPVLSSSQRILSTIVLIVLPRNINGFEEQFQNANECSQILEMPSLLSQSSNVYANPINGLTQATTYATTSSSNPSSSHMLPIHAYCPTQVPSFST